MDAFVATLPEQTVVFVAILARIVALLVAFPALSSQSIPTVVRAAVAVSFTLLFFPILSPLFSAAQTNDIMDPGRLIVFVCAEFLSGALIGWLAQLMVLSFPVAVQMMSTFIGLSNVLQPDPELGAQSTPISHMAQLAVTVVIFTSGLYVLPLNAFVGSYHVFPPGHFPFLGDAAKAVARETGHSFLLAFQLAMPMILIGTIWPMMLGVLSRFSPGLQVYSLAMPAQLLGGLLLLALLLKAMLSVWMHATTNGFGSLPGVGF